MAEKLYYTMGEISEMFDVNQSLIRHWEKQFSVLKPKRNKKGNRLFSPQDVERLKLIYHLVKERGMTLEGARRALRQHRAADGVSRDAELMERLQHIRSLLAEVREELKRAPGEVYSSAEAEGVDAPAAPAREERMAPAKRADAENAAEAAAAVTPAAEAAQPAGVHEQVEAPRGAEVSGGAAAENTPQPAARGRRGRRKKEEEHKELFAFYEQSLF